MQNFTELLNRSLVNPLKERLASLQSANAENAGLREALAKDLQVANVRQEKIDSNLNELAKKLQTVIGRIDIIEQDFQISLQSQNALISALESLKWNEENGTDIEPTVTQKTSSCN